MSLYDFTTAKENYRTFCENGNHDIQIFARPWYLDAVCESPDDWRVIIYKQDGKIVAAFPFQYTKSRKGIYTIANPWLAPRLGIWMDYGKRNKRQKCESFENKVVEYIIDNLPPFDYFRVAFDRRFKNWHGFYRAGFSQTSHYSYILKSEEIDNEYMTRMASAPRRAINNGKNIFDIVRTNHFSSCYDFMLLTYEKLNREISMSRERFDRLFNMIESHNAGFTYYAFYKNNRKAAMAIIVKDSQRAYHMISAYDHLLPRGAQPVLVYKAIQDSAAEGLDFDFEGSMIPGVARYNSGFNAELEEYYVISKCSPRLKFRQNIIENLLIIKNWFLTKRDSKDMDRSD